MAVSQPLARLLDSLEGMQPASHRPVKKDSETIVRPESRRIRNGNGGGIVKSKVLIVVLGVLLMPATVCGEDSWLIVDNHAVNDGEPLWLSFVTGQIFPVGDAPNDPANVVEFVDRWEGDVRQVTGYARQDRGLSVRKPISGNGIHVLGCTLARDVVSMSPEEFDGYLLRERAEQALALRAEQPARGTTVSEVYTKFAKTIVEVYPAKSDDGSYRVPLGQRLEIIPLSNPCRWQDGVTVEVLVLLDGYPWPNVAVSAGHEGAEYGAYAVTMKTDSAGIARIPLTRPGHWFVRAHLIRPTDGIGRPQWESFWASLTFRVAGPVDVDEILRMVRAIQRVVQPWVLAGYQVAQRAMGEIARDVFVMTPAAPSPTSPLASLPRPVNRSARLPRPAPSRDLVRSAGGPAPGSPMVSR
jgi:uncharacterized GH25 family protein